MELLSLFILLPIVSALSILVTKSGALQYIIVTFTAMVLSAVSVYLFFTPLDSMYFSFSHTAEIVLIVADILLLLFFTYQGTLFKSKLVVILALVQLFLYLLVEVSVGTVQGDTLLVDKLSLLMFLIINIVGGSIIFYAVRYMSDENMPNFRKRLFVAYLLLFISVMNLIVMTNSLLLFFFLFEVTTLASYLLIAFRNDGVSRANALKALWMNQIGGVVILLGTLVSISSFDTIYFDVLLNSTGGYLLFAVALLSMAALVKGASLPFDGWLLGAMVAPTPVSAILHSATMVKIAPFLILKFSPLLEASFLGTLLAILGALGFMMASYLALSRTVLKEILGYSTISLLGLMISLAAIGTKETVFLAMVLIFFHAFSKALLFLSAGVLEKKFHLKDIEDMKGLVQIAPRTVGFVLFGFVSLTLPPFGLFMGKVFAIESIVASLENNPWLLIALVSILIGSALLVLLYFKVASALLAKKSDIQATKKESFEFGFDLPLIGLTIVILVSALGYVFMQKENTLLLFVVPMLILMLLPWLIKKMDGFDRTKVYHCGEKEPFTSALFYFEPSTHVKKLLYGFFTLMFIAVAVVGGIS